MVFNFFFEPQVLRLVDYLFFIRVACDLICFKLSANFSDT